MSLQTREKLVTCPYNPCHQIIPQRLAQHLIKCRKANQDQEMSVCPFNATHHVAKDSLQEHIKVCKDKNVVERDIYEAREHQSFHKPVLSMLDSPLADSNSTSEDWESEVSQPAYDPNSNSLMRDVVRQPPAGLGKSARVKWRIAEAERVRKVKDDLPIGHILYPSNDGEVALETLLEGNKDYMSHSAPAVREDEETASLGKAVMRMNFQTRKPKVDVASNADAASRLSKKQSSPAPTLTRVGVGRGRIPATATPVTFSAGRGLHKKNLDNKPGHT